jgi:hypothetical protein
MHSRLLSDKSKGKRPLGRPKRRWKDSNGYLKQKRRKWTSTAFQLRIETSGGFLRIRH